MKQNEIAQIRQTDLFNPGNTGFFGSQGGYPYPGISDPFMGGGNLPAPYYGPQTPIPFGGAPGGAPGGAAGGAAGGSSFNISQIKGFIDRMGGIDGIVGTMTRVQKMVASFQQMAPMIKLLLGSFGGAKASAKALNNRPSYTARRKRRSKKTNRSLKKYRTGSGKTWVPKGRKHR